MALDHELNLAILLYIGWKKESYPHTLPGRIYEEFGERKGKELEKRIKRIIGELNNLPIEWFGADVAIESKRAVQILASRHPELDEEALAALRWSVSFNRDR